MDASMAPAATDQPRRKARPKPPNAGKGRPKGSKNKFTLEMKAELRSAREIFRNAMGLEMPDGHTIDGKAVDNRKRLAKMYAGQLKPTPADIAMLRLGFSYLFGLPGKMEEDDAGRKRMVFLSHPWEQDPMKDQEAQAIAAQAAQEKIEHAAMERKLKGEESDLNDEVPQVVR